jgi:hypothetical protein
MKSSIFMLAGVGFFISLVVERLPGRPAFPTSLERRFAGTTATNQHLNQMEN